MALAVIQSCLGGSSFTVDFTGTTPSAGQVYYFDFTGATTDGCYTILPDEPTIVVDGVQYSNLFNNCSECAENPTPTPTKTVTPTPTITPTISLTPTITPTISLTPTITPTISLTPTITPTITPTSTVTPTPTVSVSPTITPTNTITPTPSVTSTLTPTPTITPTETVTPTATVTPTITPTSTVTPTPTITPTMTPTPSPLPNVVLRNCITGEEVIVPKMSTNIGDIVSATGDTTDCYEVISFTSQTPRDNISNNYDDCLECYQSEFTSVVFSSCTDNNDTVTLTASTSSLTFLPNLSSTYYMTFSGSSLEYVGCFNFVEFSNAPNQYQITSDDEYTSCYNCRVVNIPTSANTPYYECRICCPCGTGSTANSVSVPHPVYSNQFGQDVAQLNAVQLGGTYGLNN